MDWQTTSTVLDRLGDFSDRTAWDGFAGRFRQPLVSFARAMGLAEADAEDVAQTTLMDFAEAYRAGSFDRTRGRLSAWLFGIAFRRVQKTRRHAARRERQVARGSDGTSFWSDLPDEQSAVASWDQEWERAVLQCAGASASS